MKQLTIYHNARCSKSRETMCILNENSKKAEVKIVDYIKTPPTYAELKDILVKLNMKPEQIVRKNEKLFLKKFAGKKFSPEEWIKIMIENPILIERPIVVAKHKAVIGRPPENVEALLK
jgi:arsenate reductase